MKTIEKSGATAVIPDIPSRARRSLARKHPLDEALHAERPLVERAPSKLKCFRRVATRAETTAQNDLAVVKIAATILWLR